MSFGQQSQDVFRDKGRSRALECGMAVRLASLRTALFAHSALRPRSSARRGCRRRHRSRPCCCAGRSRTSARLSGRIPIIRSGVGPETRRRSGRGSRTHVSTRCHHGEVGWRTGLRYGTGSTRSIWTDKSRERNGRCQDLANDIAHGRIDPPGVSMRKMTSAAFSPRCHLDARRT